MQGNNQIIKNKKILIFGASGFIGTNLVKKLNHHNKLYLPKINLENYNFLKSIKLKNSLFTKILNKKIDIIINLHAQTDVTYSNNNPSYDFYHNCLIHFALIEFYKNKKNKPFYINVGTATQIGFTDLKKPINKKLPNIPETFFDLHKQFGEDLINLSNKIHNFPSTTLRLTNVYGFGSTYSTKRGVIYSIIKASYEKKIINIFGDGKFVRDFIYIDDVISAIILACKYRNKLINKFYYICSGKGYSFNKFSKILQKNLKNKYDINLKINYTKWPYKTPRINKRSFVGNPKEFKKITGFNSKVNLENGINKILKNISEN